MENKLIRPPQEWIAWATRLWKVAMEAGAERVASYLTVNAVEELAGTPYGEEIPRLGTDGGLHIRYECGGEVAHYYTGVFQDEQVEADLKEQVQARARQGRREVASAVVDPEVMIASGTPGLEKESLLLKDHPMSTKMAAIEKLFEDTASLFLHRWELKREVSYTGLVQSEGTSMFYSQQRISLYLLLEGEHGFIEEGTFAQRVNELKLDPLMDRLRQRIGWGRNGQARVPEGSYSLRIPPSIASELIRKLGVLFSGNRVAYYPRMRSWVGKRLAPPFVTLVDDGRYEGGWWQAPWDDEGTRTQKSVLLQQGVLQGFLHSKKTAAFLKSVATGNGFRPRYDYAPDVSTTNLYLEAGTHSYAAWRREVTAGIDLTHATSPPLFTGQQGEIQFYANGWLIKEGVPSTALTSLLVSVRPFHLLRKMKGLGEDLTFSLIARGAGAPSIYLDDGECKAGKLII